MISMPFSRFLCANYQVMAKNLFLKLNSIDLFLYLFMRIMLLNFGCDFVMRRCWDRGRYIDSSTILFLSKISFQHVVDWKVELTAYINIFSFTEWVDVEKFVNEVVLLELRILDVSSMQRFPFSSNSFDMARCSRCLIPLILLWLCLCLGKLWEDIPEVHVLCLQDDALSIFVSFVSEPQPEAELDIFRSLVNLCHGKLPLQMFAYPQSSYQVPGMSESTTALAIGLCTGFIIHVTTGGTSSSLFVFSEELFFTYLQRIISCKGRIFALPEEPDVARVWLPNINCPGLAMARAFGDFCIKDYGLISTPQVTRREITDDDDFIVLTKDGVWDVLSNNEVVRIVSTCPEPSITAKNLVEHAVRAWWTKYPSTRVDDYAVICLFLKILTSISHDQISEWDNDYCKETIENEKVALTQRQQEKINKNEWLAHEVLTRANTLVCIPRFDAAAMVIKESVEPLLEEYKPPGIKVWEFSKLSNIVPKIEDI